MKTFLERSAAAAMDSAMCAMMNFLQRRHHVRACSREEFEAYLAACAPLTREEFYHAPTLVPIREDASWLEWDSPRPSGLVENDRVRVKLHLCGKGFAAPTVLILHALMSASDAGYTKLAQWFNARGWNAAFPHLPYHYSRVPKGTLNGELAITANLIRNAENVRQCVTELRQLIAFLRARGCPAFAAIGTSYGGWNGALLSFLEDLRFLALIQPIVNLEHAIWENPASASVRRYLRSKGFEPGRSGEHAHLSSPLHGTPLCGGDRCIITGGLYDTISPSRELRSLQQKWVGARFIEVPQGHFGYRALRETLPAIEDLIS